MSVKLHQVLAAALVFSAAFAGAASADVTQTAVGIQQGVQSQYLEGRGTQTGVNVQNMGQYQFGRPSYRGENIQQTAAGVQTNELYQQGFGRVNQTMVDMRNLQQRQMTGGFGREGGFRRGGGRFGGY